MTWFEQMREEERAQKEKENGLLSEFFRVAERQGFTLGELDDCLERFKRQIRRKMREIPVSR